MGNSKRPRYVAALIASGIVFAIGTALVMNRSGITQTGNSNGFYISGVLQGNESALPLYYNTPQPVRPSGVDVPISSSYGRPATTATPVKSEAVSDVFDWNSFIASLTHFSNQASKTDPGEDSLADAYAFIPSGLISPPKQKSSEEMSETQKAIYGWGQDAGNSILSYEQQHPNQPQILTDFIQDRENPLKIAEMKRLGADLIAVGDHIAEIGTVPGQLKTASTELASAYREIGANLSKIPDAKGDEALVEAILKYNGSAEAFVGKFVNVVLIFQAHDVKFTQNEAGGVFMFPSGQ
jgi:hypothetical protein